MASQFDQTQTIGLMAAHEAAIGDLYEAYSGKFPDLAEFFATLAAAERDHARWLAGLAEGVKTGSVYVNPNRFNAQAVMSSLDHVKERLEEAGSAEMTLREALSTALDLEEALIEKQYYQTIEGDSAEVKDLLRRLSEQTAEHIGQVRREWETERQRKV